MEKIEEKIKEWIKDYVEEQIEHFIVNEKEFSRQFKNEDVSIAERIRETINQEYGWNIDGNEEGLAYDIGYVRGLRDAIEIMEREGKDNATI